MSDVLVDSSVWIDFFRGQAQAVSRVDPLLADDRAATTEMIVAEIASGARTRADFDSLRQHFAALPKLAAPGDLWGRVAETRFVLARQGVQSHLVDLAIAITASEAGHRLLTRDRDFVAIARATSLEVDIF